LDFYSYFLSFSKSRKLQWYGLIFLLSLSHLRKMKIIKWKYNYFILYLFLSSLSKKKNNQTKSILLFHIHFTFTFLKIIKEPKNRKFQVGVLPFDNYTILVWETSIFPNHSLIAPAVLPPAMLQPLCNASHYCDQDQHYLILTRVPLQHFLSQLPLPHSCKWFQASPPTVIDSIF